MKYFILSLLILQVLQTFQAREKLNNKLKTKCSGLDIKTFLDSFISNKKIDTKKELNTLTKEDMSKENLVLLQKFDACFSKTKLKLKRNLIQTDPSYGIKSNPYAPEFYSDANVIGYTGNLLGVGVNRPTIYYFLSNYSASSLFDKIGTCIGHMGKGEYGHITQVHGIRNNIGREKVDFNFYMIMNHAKNEGNSVEFTFDKFKRNYVEIHFSRSPFTCLAQPNLGILTANVGGKLATIKAMYLNLKSRK